MSSNFFRDRNTIVLLRSFIWNDRVYNIFFIIIIIVLKVYRIVIVILRVYRIIIVLTVLIIYLVSRVGNDSTVCGYLFPFGISKFLKQELSLCELA